MWLCSRMDGSQRFAFLVFLCKATGIFHLWSLWTSTLPFRCCFHVLFQSVSHEWYFPCLPTEIVLGTEWASFPTLIKYRFTLSGCWRFVQKSQFLGVWGHLFSPSADLKWTRLMFPWQSDNRTEAPSLHLVEYLECYLLAKCGIAS